MSGMGGTRRRLAALAGAAAAAVVVAGVGRAAHVAPVYAEGNNEYRSCAAAAASLGLTGSWYGFKVDGAPGNQTYTSGELAVTVSNATSSAFDWDSNLGLDAVFVKAGDGANVYAYDAETADEGLVSPQGKKISHVLFCGRARLEVSATAAASLVRTHAWEVAKSASPAAATAAVGQSASTTWAVSLDETVTDGGWTVAGVVGIANVSPTDTLVTLASELAGATVVFEPTCASAFMVTAGASVTCQYTATYASDPGTGVLTAMVTADAQEDGVGDGSAGASFSFASALVTTLGHATVDLNDAQGGPFANSYSGDTSVSYAASYPCAAAGVRTLANRVDVTPDGEEGPVLDSASAIFTLTCEAARVDDPNGPTGGGEQQQQQEQRQQEQTAGAGGTTQQQPAATAPPAAPAVSAPFTPPTAKPKPRAKAKAARRPTRKPAVKTAVCLELRIVQKAISAGASSRVTMRVRAGGRPAKGVALRLRGAGIDRTVRTNALGLARALVAPRVAGIVTVSVVNAKACGSARRVGVVGAFEPPVTG